MITLPNSVQKLCNLLITHHYQPIIVGGYVRDSFLHVESKDIDIELYNVSTLDELIPLLSQYYSVNEVGRSFGVLKVSLEAFEIDISLPRTEIKTGQTHREFEVTTHKNITFTEAAHRRDFSINAMGYDVSTCKILDPYNGLSDIKAKRLQCVDKKTFVEDPLRLFRAVQFCARFEFTCSNELQELLLYMYKDNQLSFLPQERVYEEVKKLLLKSKKPSIGFDMMKEIGILSYFPEVYALIGVVQDPIYHAEGDVYIHTMMVLDEMAKLTFKDEKEKLTLMLAALCHDFGKPISTEIIEGKIRAIEHEITGIQPSIDFLERLTNEKNLIDEVANLVKHHLKVMQFYKGGAKAPAIRRLACEINIQTLVKLAEADFMGRLSENKTDIFEAGEWLVEQSRALHVESQRPKMFIQGRDLINVGLKPSKEFSNILNNVFEAQLDGEFDTYEKALIYLNNHLQVKG